MQATICDFCKSPVAEGDESHIVNIDHADKDCCKVCWNSSIILSEMRRTRTRKAVKKAGRPKKQASLSIQSGGVVMPIVEKI